ncbi:hypothetical protein LCGC14_0763590 [marine sediment metagenome]|uniref:Uncharacterized protein n=1 Tax=marine sediment metagenome TaxID=412755 RepID=A0A0F9SKG0_9ZZZZ
MDFNESAQNLRELISHLVPCTHCRGIGSLPGRWRLRPCPTCQNTGREALSDSEIKIELAALEGLRYAFKVGCLPEADPIDFNELEEIGG